jgi:exodeoxyribonuclease V alpha subunit
MSDAISTLDRRFGEWVATHFSGDMAQRDRTTLQRLAEAVSLAVSLKHTCLDCDVYPHLGEPLFASLLKGIKAADVQRVVTPDVKPLVASSDGRHIWLHKYHVFERAVAALLTVMQQEKRLEIITGGPGTGKTWTAAERIKQELAANPHCVIQLAAPTGKAANNMMVALTRAGFDGSAYPVKGLTLHALLGMNGRSPKPRHNRQHPLICDVLIVDEASMIDLPMMYRLLLAIPSTATLLLLGDQDQLASVEAGSVLADICRAFADSGCIKRLTDSHRSKNSPEISVLANALNKGTLPDMQSNRSVHCHILAAGDTRQPAWLRSGRCRLWLDWSCIAVRHIG